MPRIEYADRHIDAHVDRSAYDGRAQEEATHRELLSRISDNYESVVAGL